MTTSVDAAAVSLYVVIQRPPFPVSGMADLAKGAGGEYRYVFAECDPQEKRKVAEVMLFRSRNSIACPPYGWDRMTGDLNCMRGGEYLYIIYKTKAT